MGRTLIVGDIHGCRAEVEDLLSKVGFSRDDRLCFVGDLVARGPDSRGVLALARRLRARAVMGNHEERLLQAHHAAQHGLPGPRLGFSHAELLLELTDEDWSQIRAFPLHLDLPEHGVRIVHAGLDPRVPFAAQDPWVLTHVRTLGADGASSRWKGPRWAETYDGPEHVVFGHNAQQAVQIHAHATGLDTGCVYGGQLTALLLGEGQRVPGPELRPDVIVSVAARGRYVPFGRGLPRGRGADFVPGVD